MKTGGFGLRATSRRIAFLRLNNTSHDTSHDSYDDNDKHEGDSNNDDPFLGSIKWFLFLSKRTKFLSLNRSLNVGGCFRVVALGADEVFNEDIWVY